MKQLIEVLKDPGVTIIDVRSPIEYRREHIEGAINIPVKYISKRLVEVSKLSPIVVYCQTGIRSIIATEILRNNGLIAYNGGSIKNMKDFRVISFSSYP